MQKNGNPCTRVLASSRKISGWITPKKRGKLTFGRGKLGDSQHLQKLYFYSRSCRISLFLEMKTGGMRYTA